MGRTKKVLTPKEEAERKAKRKEYQKNYHAKNAEELRKKHKEWRNKNPEKELEKVKRYQEKHPEKIKAQRKAYRDANPDASRIAAKKWRAKKHKQGQRETNGQVREKQGDHQEADEGSICRTPIIPRPSPLSPDSGRSVPRFASRTRRLRRRNCTP
jgi:septal ring factor EnvC (AmiA/AmiB activator)